MGVLQGALKEELVVKESYSPIPVMWDNNILWFV